MGVDDVTDPTAGGLGTPRKDPPDPANPACAGRRERGGEGPREDTAPPAQPSSPLTLESTPESVAAARAYARDMVAFLAPELSPERMSDVELVVSELVTNAVRYGTEPGDSLLVVVEAGVDRLRIEVHDPVRRTPRPRPESARRERGRGLVVLNALTRWGTDDRPLGKVVWAEIRW
ncbi:ATP-binding protein [Streptomyces katsurahamanus]|uniref:ATP-binding protein n=1 Tax=Streptomyces katsurahamanus TaxID=2577098 RepID=A0ABW9NMB5_9ACTN|nr:ATP-binding protein [Streptomyces katsurahamanus]